MFEELATLKALHEAEPDLLIVPGHDMAAIDGLIARRARCLRVQATRACRPPGRGGLVPAEDREHCVNPSSRQGAR